MEDSISPELVQQYTDHIRRTGKIHNVKEYLETTAALAQVRIIAAGLSMWFDTKEITSYIEKDTLVFIPLKNHKPINWIKLQYYTRIKKIKQPVTMDWNKYCDTLRNMCPFAIDVKFTMPSKNP